jgi:DNA invertase Pin-like site-specific DNA recombinase
VSEPDVDGGDPTRVLVRQVFGAIAQYERALISARMQAGRAAKAARGGFAFGSPPFGYRASDKQLAPEPNEQAALARIVEMRRRGATFRAIAEALDAEGFEPKRSQRWHPEKVRRIVARADLAIA